MPLRVSVGIGSGSLTSNWVFAKFARKKNVSTDTRYLSQAEWIDFHGFEMKKVKDFDERHACLKRDV